MALLSLVKELKVFLSSAELIDRSIFFSRRTAFPVWMADVAENCDNFPCGRRSSGKLARPPNSSVLQSLARFPALIWAPRGFDKRVARTVSQLDARTHAASALRAPLAPSLPRRA